MLQDGLGSVRGEIGENHDVAVSGDYEPYGLPTGVDGTYSQPFRFTGEMCDETEIQYHRKRYYALSLSLWTALDIWEGNVSAPLSLNSYSWVEGNTINAVDPTGMCIDKELCLRFAPQAWRCNCFSLCSPPPTCQEMLQSGCNALASSRGCNSFATPTPNPYQQMFTHNPLLNGCNVIRTFSGHTSNNEQDPAEAGVDYRTPSDNGTDDPLSRKAEYKVMRKVTAVAGGEIVNLTRAQTPMNQTTSTITRQPGEDYGITLEILSCDSTQCVILQYSHIFPTIAAPNFAPIMGATMGPREYTLDDQETFLRGPGISYTTILPSRVGNLQGNYRVNAGDVMGFYAQIGRSTIGPHLHISMFRGPAKESAEFNT